MGLTEEEKMIVEENHNLIYGFCKMKGIKIEDYYGDLAIALCEAAKTYDGKKSKFSTYVYYKFQSVLDSTYRNQNRDKRKINNQTISIDGAEGVICYAKERNSIDSLHNCILIKNILKKSTIGNLLLKGFNQNEIANELSISQSEVSRECKKIKDKIKKEI